MTTVFLDTALAYDPVTRRCDLVFDGADLILETTPVTALLMAVGLDRRAHTDDVLPDPPADPLAPARLDAWGGWWGDFLDPATLLTGSRLWLFQRRKQDEDTRVGVEAALKEPLDDLARLRGWPIQIAVRWVRYQMLGYRVTVGPAELALNLSGAA